MTTPFGLDHADETNAPQWAGQSRLHQQACLLLWVTLRKH
jgi:hypothetical protein